MFFGTHVARSRCAWRRGKPAWTSCEWFEVGNESSYSIAADWCPSGTCITQIDFDSRGPANRPPIVGRVRCCRSTINEASRSANCEWRGIGYDRSHFKKGEWCGQGKYLTQVILETGDTISGSIWPVIGQAKCCQLAGETWGSSQWYDVGDAATHEQVKDWCPDGAVITQLDLDGGPLNKQNEYPFVFQVKCAEPKP